MKTKLLKKLRRQGRRMIHIHSVTTSGDLTIGMSIGYDEPEYSGLFELGDTEEDVLKKAERIYIEQYLKNKGL